MINTLFIMISVVLVTDVFQFWENFSPVISRWLTQGRIDKPIQSKLLTCSVCQSWWLNLLYLIISHNLSLMNIMIILLLSFSTSIVYDLLLMIENLVKSLIAKINARIL